LGRVAPSRRRRGKSSGSHGSIRPTRVEVLPPAWHQSGGTSLRSPRNLGSPNPRVTPTPCFTKRSPRAEHRRNGISLGGNRVRAGAEVEITIHDNRKPLISRLGNRGQPGNSSLSTPSRPTCGAGNSGKSGAAVRCSEAAPPRPRSPQGGRQQSRQQLTRGAFLRQGIRDQRALNGRPGSGAAVRR
jgi:hypothetical protein